jgi:hypothetical protein
MADPRLDERMARQLRSFAGPQRDHWPDAFLSIHEAVEDALQRSAGGGRTAWFSRSEPLQDPQAWEEALGPLLVVNPALALALEQTRRPRPDIPLPPSPADPVWTTPFTADGRSSSTRRDHHDSADRRRMASVHQDQREAPTVDDLPAVGADWSVFASAERLTTFPTYPSKGPDHITWRIRAIELGADRMQSHASACPPEDPPVARGDFSDWLIATTAATPRLPHGARQLVALDADLNAAGDARTGPGLPSRLLAPTQPLIHILGLGPSQKVPFLLCHGDDRRWSS